YSMDAASPIWANRMTVIHFRNGRLMVRMIGYRYRLAAASVLFLVLRGAASAEPPAERQLLPAAASEPAISAGDLRPHGESLASPGLEGRGTAKGKRLAREYIEGKFRDLHLAPLFGETEFVQEIPGPPGKQGQRTLLGKNIGAWLPGSDPALRDECVILSAHY